MNAPDKDLDARLLQLAHAVVRTLNAKGLTCAAAESCTGGLVGHLLTEISGSSDCFWGSAVTYSYEAKSQVLGVDSELLESKGAVSAEVAHRMAIGARNLYAVDIAVSITGVAGPGGGSVEKPVGTVFLHILGPDNFSRGAHHIWTADRTGNKNYSAEAALQLILESVQEPPTKIVAE